MNKELLNENIKDTELIINASKSYLGKEELINIINQLKFSKIKSLRMELISGFQIKENKETNKRYVETLGYEIEIT